MAIVAKGTYKHGKDIIEFSLSMQADGHYQLRQKNLSTKQVSVDRTDDLQAVAGFLEDAEKHATWSVKPPVGMLAGTKEKKITMEKIRRDTLLSMAKKGMLEGKRHEKWLPVNVMTKLSDMKSDMYNLFEIEFKGRGGNAWKNPDGTIILWYTQRDIHHFREVKPGTGKLVVKAGRYTGTPGETVRRDWLMRRVKAGEFICKRNDYIGFRGVEEKFEWAGCKLLEDGGPTTGMYNLPERHFKSTIGFAKWEKDDVIYLYVHPELSYQLKQV